MINETLLKRVLAAFLVVGMGCAGSSTLASSEEVSSAPPGDPGAEGGERPTSAVDTADDAEELPNRARSRAPLPALQADGEYAAETLEGHDEDAVAPRASLALLRQLERVEDGLPRALSAGRCSDAGGIRDHICALASRVCSLAGRAPENERLHARCEDARRRCQSATTRVASRCGP